MADIPVESTALAARALRDVFGCFVTGVTVVTTLDADGRPHGLTANSFSSVSLDPPLVLWSQATAAPSHSVFREATRFAINILAEDQVQISARFARPSADKFAGIAWHEGLGGVPLIDGCAATIECVRHAVHPGGDHAIFLGAVERIERHAQRPLAFGGGRYLIVQPHDHGGRAAEAGARAMRQACAVRIATPVAADLSAELDLSLALSVWGSHGPTVVRWEEARQPASVDLRSGVVLPLTESATGLVYAAAMPRQQLHAMVAAGAAERAALDARLDAVNGRGWAAVVTDALRDLHGAPVQALAAPVFDTDGAVVLTLTAVRVGGGPLDAWAADIAPRLVAATTALSRRLATRHPHPQPVRDTERTA